MKIKWINEGLDEIGYDLNKQKVVVRVDKRYFRPCEVDSLLGDATKAKKELGWQPKIKLKSGIK